MHEWTDDFAKCVMIHCNPKEIKGCQIAFKKHLLYMEPSKSQKHVTAYGHCVRRFDKTDKRCEMEFKVHVVHRPTRNEDASVLVE